MHCSMLRGPVVHLWPRGNFLTKSAGWGHGRRVSSNGLHRAQWNEVLGNRKRVLGGGEERSLRKLCVGAVPGSQIGDANGDAFGIGNGEEPEIEPLDAVFVLAGGQLPSGGVPVWVERRLDKALELHRLNGPNCRIVCLGNGTPHRPPVLTPEGFVVHESSSCAEYLINRGAPVSVLLKEWGSFDTIGNGFFALTHHVIPRRWRRMAVITSDFHMPRSHAIFEWVFGLQGAGTSIRQANGSLVSSSGSRSQGFMVEYHGVSDVGIDTSIIQARVAKERKALEALKIVSTGISTLEDFHVWFHTQHRCYNVEHQGLFGKQPLNDPALRSY